MRRRPLCISHHALLADADGVGRAAAEASQSGMEPLRLESLRAGLHQTGGGHTSPRGESEANVVRAVDIVLSNPCSNYGLSSNTVALITSGCGKSQVRAVDIEVQFRKMLVDSQEVGPPWTRLSFCCTPPLPLAGVSTGMERGCQQNDSLVNGAGGASWSGQGQGEGAEPRHQVGRRSALPIGGAAQDGSTISRPAAAAAAARCAGATDGVVDAASVRASGGSGRLVCCDGVPKPSPVDEVRRAASLSWVLTSAGVDCWS